MALLDFGDWPAASIVYSGYDYFDSDEFHDWVGENGDAGHRNSMAAHAAHLGTVTLPPRLRYGQRNWPMEVCPQGLCLRTFNLISERRSSRANAVNSK